MPELEYIAPLTVKRCLESDAFIRGVVGPIGSGKSSGCVVEGLRRSLRQKPGPDGVRRCRGVVVRNTYRELSDTTRRTFEQWWPQAQGKWDETDFSFSIKTKSIDWEVLFRALDRPADVKKVLSLELTWAYINEAREVPKEIFDGLQGRVGRYPSRAQGGPTWFGLWFDSNPWHVGHWMHQLFKKEQPEGFELYEQPSGLGVLAENVENLPQGYYKRLCAGKDSDWVKCYVEGQYPSQDVGSVWGALVDALELRGGISDFQRMGSEVFTSWDLGIGDKTAIWWWRLGANRLPEVLEYYENSGLPLSHYLDEIEKRPCEYVRHFLPHDSRAKTLQTGISTIEMVNKRFPGKVSVTPELSLPDGLQAGRWLLEQPIRIHKTGCERGLEVLRAYRYDWDEERKVFSRNPVHDWASHGADAFRYLACAVRAAELGTRKPEEPAKGIQYAQPMGVGWSFTEILEANLRANKRRARR